MYKLSFLVNMIQLGCVLFLGIYNALLSSDNEELKEDNEKLSKDNFLLTHFITMLGLSEKFEEVVSDPEQLDNN